MSCSRVAFVYFVSYSKVKCHLSCHLSLKHNSQFKFTLLQFKILGSEIQKIFSPLLQILFYSSFGYVFLAVP